MTMGLVLELALGAIVGSLVGAFLFSKVLSRLSLGIVGNTLVSLIGAALTVAVVFFAGLELANGSGDAAALVRKILQGAPFFLGLVLGFIGGFLLLSAGGAVKKHNDT